MHEGQSRVGVVGDPPPGFDDALDGTDAVVRHGDLPDLLAADLDLLVAVGEAATLTAGRATPEAPILPVDAGRGFGSVPAEQVGAAVERALATGETRSAPVLSVSFDGDALGRALADVTLVSAEVAHISEYRVTAGGDRVSQFRADGVVVATPVGSTGYAHRLDGPVIAPGSPVGAVVPVAPFAIDPDQWVLPLGDVAVTVARDETDVTVLADGRDVATVALDDTVRISRDGRARFAVVPAGRSPYE